MKEKRYDGISKKMIHGQRPCAVGASLIGRPRAFLAKESIFSDLNFHGDGRSFSRQLQKLLRSIVSAFDAANKESFYHGFMLGLTALLRGSDYVVESNRESGYGRL